MPTFIRSEDIRYFTMIRPGFSLPRVLVDQAYEIDESLVLHEVADKVLTRTHPQFRCQIEIEPAKSLGRYEAAISRTAGETWIFWSKEQATYSRMNAVGAHQYLSGDTDAVFEFCLDVLTKIDKVNQTMFEMQPVRWQSMNQYPKHVGTMRLVVWKTERRLDNIA